MELVRCCILLVFLWGGRRIVIKCVVVLVTSGEVKVVGYEGDGDFVAD